MKKGLYAAHTGLFDTDPEGSTLCLEFNELQDNAICVTTQ